ncbi:uncharacterized protein [Macrobrachium rosenbergii]|uniref:uncharacterized protein n=1 Tax=Macrobrachium rosenbergii TaxID=79674 RepID=UPI0034D45568
MPSLEGLVSHLSGAPVMTHTATASTTKTVTVSSFGKLPVTVASHLNTQVSTAPATFHSVPLPPGFLAPLSLPGPSHMVTSSVPYMTMPVPVADPYSLLTTVSAPRFPDTWPGLAPHAPPVPPTLAPSLDSPGCRAAVSAPVAAGPSTISATQVVPASVAPHW